ncbi:hypothetical protein [Archangium sp.]|uniref:hypothetical protein n=1 Tax=Archangium sp. TaxID=1872627 RepID=UPI00389A0C20
MGTRKNEVRFPREAPLHLPLTHANERFLAFFEQQAKAKVERLPSPHRLSEQVLAALRGSTWTSA